MPPAYRTAIAKQKDKLFSGDEHVQQGREERMYTVAAEAEMFGAQKDDVQEYGRQLLFSSFRNYGQDLQLTEAETELFHRRFTSVEAHVNLRQMTSETFIQAKMRPGEGPQQTPDQSRIGAKVEKKKYDHRQKKEYEKKKEAAGSRFVSADELQTRWMHEELLEKKTSVPTGDGDESVTQQELLKRALKGDYSNLQQLDPVLRSVAAGKYMERLNINARMKTPEELVNALYKEGGVSQLMNPLFRIGISVLMRGQSGSKAIYKASDTGFWSKVEDLCNQRIMAATIYSAPEAQGSISKEDVARNRQSQIFMAKTLLAAHLGKLQKIDTFKTGYFSKQKHSEDWKGGVASAFAHCSRVAFTLPGDSATLDSMTGPEQGLQAGFFKRTAATHKLSKKKRKPDSGSMVEKKSWGTFYGQRGMNVAIGGLGNEGIPGRDGQERILKNDGSCGHLYMHVEEGGSSDYTGLLIGFESDSPGTVNMTGHTHDWRAKPEFASSFGGQRCDEIGDKYGGRVVDLSSMDPKVFEGYMQRLESFMTQKMNEAEQGGPAGEQAQTELMNLADKLSGELMTREEIDKLF